jgi:dolichyl-phosphate-mannose-protein mannosyltransferase
LTIFNRPFREQLRSGATSDLPAAVVVAAGFCWRLWLAHATFFNTDEAWHFSVANQNSLAAAYRASLSLAHPPLLIFVLYFWKHFFSSDVMLRSPGVLAGTIFCWVFYKWLTVLFGRAAAWCGLIFAAFLPPMIVLSAELRQYSWMLLFAVSAAYFLERAFAENSVRAMLLSSLWLWLAMLSHYSAFLFAAGIGIYALLRMIRQRPSTAAIVSWAGGQLAGVALAAFLVATHISKLGSVYPGDPLRRFGDFYLSDVYFHAGKESLPHFLYRGTFGVFRFICAQRTAGHLMTVLFVAGIICLLWSARRESIPSRSRLLALLLVLPFFINWIAVVAGFYPYGRTRQCVFLAIFGLAGVSYCLAKICSARISGNRSWLAACLAVVIVGACHIFGTPHSLDMIVTAEQRHEHMDAAMAFVRSQISPADILFTDKPTSFQLMHYLCGPQPVSVRSAADGFDSFDCNGIRVISTDLNSGSLTAQSFPEKLHAMESDFPPNSALTIWVVQAAWSSGLGEALHAESGDFAAIELRVFDRYIEVFKVPRPAVALPPAR